MKKGFTLIELLVVIAILAVLMSVVVVTINPAEMLKKTRDTKRISDLDALRTAINLYVTDQSSLPDSTCRASQVGAPNISSNCTSPMQSTAQSPSNNWLGLDFSTISSGSPLSTIPLDPKNTTTTAATTSYVYYFKPSSTSTTFTLLCNME
ncbi:MAG: type II secretion system protein, partial [Candidatus Pacebacteria bacterium]|nr:type II secretion system protein [Candidatus Paceibacterota bacterium]